ncbi:MAG: DUF421 domain-containing protein [Bdellovibrionales bacterium]|nr:DUF421 domain-containing protein [Bdellovibrionales bacterium]
MWGLSQPWWEFVFRGAVIYTFVFILFRLTGKRQVGQLTPFDLVLLLLIGNAVQNSMNAGDNSITGGLILSITLVALNVGVDRLTFASKKIQQVVEGSPKVLIHNGKVNHEMLDHEKVTMRDLELALRQEGVMDTATVRFAILESNGQISVIKKENS